MIQPVGCELESGLYPAGSVVADDPGFVTGPAGQSLLASLGTTEHPEHGSTKNGRNIFVLMRIQILNLSQSCAAVLT